ncbi:DUF4123 domain-containing protein [Pseudomonas sp. JH-2]|uniref:DUF4123 domain-containing protein n=1 Tax=Pseudomonas sp. JH-2 TaxID=3114998 RepID=UPI002E25A6CB|nr:DUF4123 domain-containing protein [Pseudomonas sp. JH-2]
MSPQWLQHIEKVCASVETQQVDLILDQTGLEHSVLQALGQIQPSISWCSLFDGTPEEHLLDQAPILMRLDLTLWQHKAWLEEVIASCAADARLMVMITPLGFEALGEALRALLQAEWGGQSFLLRYYDPRIFPILLSSVLTPEQRMGFMQVACYWGWLDRDGETQWLPGACLRETRTIQPSDVLVVNDQQADLLGCISDAQSLLHAGHYNHLATTQEECFGHLYKWVLMASEQGYVGDLKEYVQKHLGVSTEAT